MDTEERLRRALADRYRIEGQIGRGGMATVYLAYDLKLDRPVALKVLRPEIASSLGPDYFSREIRIEAGLSHPNILALFDGGEADGLLYYTMPFVEGESLRGRLNREKQLPLEDALAIAREVAEALAYAHRQGLVHRDIKPENILFRGGHAVVADFGIARVVSKAGGGALTEAGLVVGTPAYMSPEQAAGERDIDGRADLYSLGCVLYEMLSGDAPYLASTPKAMLAKKLSEPVPRISVVRETVPAGLEAALVKALAPIPADRYRTVEEFGAALERAAAPVPAPVKPRWGRAKPVVYAGTVVLGLATIGVIASDWGSGEPKLGEDPRPRIAVLPCASLSPDPRDEFYAEAVHDAVITRLQRVSGILPTGRSSVIGYRDNPAAPSRVARELNVTYLGECSVLKVENRVQVRFRLIDALVGTQVWADHFEAVLVGPAGIIDLQSEIARRVVEGVGAGLTPEEQSRFAARPTLDLDAYEMYMIGRNRVAQYSRESLEDAIRYFKAAIRADSAFAVAHAGLAEALILLPIYDVTIRPAEVREQARAAVTRAYELDPGAGEVHSSMGLFLHFHEWEWAAAERHYREGLRLVPGDVQARVYFASLLSALGRFDEGAEEARLVLAMDPRSSGVIWSTGNRMWQAGRVAEARVLYERATQIEPPNLWAFSHLAFSLAWDEPRDLARAAELLSGFVRRVGYPDPERVRIVVETIAGRSADRAQAMEVLNDVVAATALERPHMIFEFAALAPADVLFGLLDEAVRARHVWVPWIPISVAQVRPEVLDDPRWTDFLRAIKHPGLSPR